MSRAHRGVAFGEAQVALGFSPGRASAVDADTAGRGRVVGQSRHAGGGARRSFTGRRGGAARLLCLAHVRREAQARILLSLLVARTSFGDCLGLGRSLRIDADSAGRGRVVGKRAHAGGRALRRGSAEGGGFSGLACVGLLALARVDGVSFGFRCCAALAVHADRAGEGRVQADARLRRVRAQRRAVRGVEAHTGGGLLDWRQHRAGHDGLGHAQHRVAGAVGDVRAGLVGEVQVVQRLVDALVAKLLAHGGLGRGVFQRLRDFHHPVAEWRGRDRGGPVDRLGQIGLGDFGRGGAAGAAIHLHVLLVVGHHRFHAGQRVVFLPGRDARNLSAALDVHCGALDAGVDGARHRPTLGQLLVPHLCGGMAVATQHPGRAAHRSAGQQAQRGGLVDAFVQRLAQGRVLHDLLLNRLRQFFQDAFRHRAFEEAANCTLLDVAQRGTLRGGRCRLERALHQHRVHVTDAQATRHLAAGNAKGRGAYARCCGERGLLGGQQSVLGLLADLLGRRPTACDAFARSARNGRAHAGRDSAQATTHNTARAHHWQGLGNRSSDHARVLHGRGQRVHKAVSRLHLAHGRLRLGRVKLIERGLGFLRAESRLFGQLAGIAAGGKVSQADSGLGHTNGTLQQRNAAVLQDAPHGAAGLRRLCGGLLIAQDKRRIELKPIRNVIDGRCAGVPSFLGHVLAWDADAVLACKCDVLGGQLVLAAAGQPHAALKLLVFATLLLGLALRLANGRADAARD